MTKTIFLILLFFCCATLQAQTGKKTDLWNWTDSKPHHKSIVKVKVTINSDLNNDGIFDDYNNDGVLDEFQSFGSGVVIYVDKSKEINTKTRKGYLGHVMTAAHVVAKMKNENKEIILGIGVSYQNGASCSQCTVKAIDKNHDIAIILAWIPADIEPTKIATVSAKWKDWVEYAGFGGETKISNPRTFSGTLSRPSNSHQFFSHDTYFIKGDSGGPAWNDKAELIGIISGGSIWWTTGLEGLKSTSGGETRPTWPTRCNGLDPIKKLIDSVRPK